MIDPSVTESGIGLVITSVIVGLMHSLRVDQSRSRRKWEARIEVALEHVEKATNSFRDEMDHERKQRMEMADRMIALMASLTANRETMTKLNQAFARFVDESEKRLKHLETNQTEVLQLSKELRLIREKRSGK